MDIVHELSTICPFCLYACTSATPADHDHESAPEDGDISLCIKCGEWSVFDSAQAHKMRKPSWPEYQRIAADKELRRMRGAWLIVQRKEKPRRRRL